MVNPLCPSFRDVWFPFPFHSFVDEGTLSFTMALFRADASQDPMTFIRRNNGIILIVCVVALQTHIGIVLHQRTDTILPIQLFTGCGDELCESNGNPAPGAEMARLNIFKGISPDTHAKLEKDVHPSEFDTVCFAIHRITADG